MAFAKQRYPVKLFGVCLIPNHFHALIQPERNGALSAYMQWVLARYACDLRTRTGTLGYGHVFQRRFWSDGIDDTFHFLSVLRYIEANPVRARLVGEAESWPWSSLSLRGTTRGKLLDPLPVMLPARWSSIVNVAQLPSVLEAHRHPRALRTAQPQPATAISAVEQE